MSKGNHDPQFALSEKKLLGLFHFTLLYNNFISFQFPKNESEWQLIAKQFEERWNFPNCLGSVDGKHVQIIPPANSGSYYYNYKGTHSLVLMAIANANYEFIGVDFGANGRLSDGGVIEFTPFYRKLINGELNLPNKAKPCNSNQVLPYVFIGDEAFSLRNDFLKPYSQKELDKARRIFNYRLSRARRIIENTFGILVSTFRVYMQPINLKVENIDKVVMATCVLHNFLRRKRGENYFPSSQFATEDESSDALRNKESLISLQKGHNRNSSESAKAVRELFKNYFCNEGALPWQEIHI